MTQITCSHAPQTPPTSPHPVCEPTPLKYPTSLDWKKTKNQTRAEATTTTLPRILYLVHRILYILLCTLNITSFIPYIIYITLHITSITPHIGHVKQTIVNNILKNVIYCIVLRVVCSISCLIYCILLKF